MMQEPPDYDGGDIGNDRSGVNVRWVNEIPQQTVNIRSVDLQSLPSPARKVVSLIYGIDGEPKTVSEVARRLKVQRGIVQALHSMAIVVLRSEIASNDD